MGFEAEILADSVSETIPHRLTTFRVKVPVFVHYEILRHRMFSFSVASTRAIPLKKQIDAVEDDPFIPISWGKNQPGMIADEEGDFGFIERCLISWKGALRSTLSYANALEVFGLHKQTAARLLMPFAWMDMVITGVWPAYANFFTLRCHKAAQPEIRKIAVMMARSFRDSIPTKLEMLQWHLPFVRRSDRDRILDSDPIKSSVARCARVSYGRSRGESSSTPMSDGALHDRLIADGHWSPTEHQARAPLPGDDVARLQGNLTGWVQYRQTLLPNVHTDFDFSALDSFQDG